MGKSRNFFKDFFKDKARLHRYSAMMVISILGLGGFVCFDSVGALQEALMEYLQLSASDFSLMYSVNAWPNIVLCFFGGFLIDRLFGIKWGTIIYAVITIVGHIIFSLGVLFGLFWLSLMGRFVFGIGVELMFICLQCYVIVWFKGNELSMVVCLMVSVSRLGTSIMFEIATPLYNALRHKFNGRQAIGIVYIIVGTMPFISLLCGFILKRMDPKKYDKKHYEDGETSKIDHSDKKKKISFKDILHFPFSLWLIALAYCGFCTSIFVLIPFSQGFFTTHFKLSVEEANSVTSFFSILGAVIAPFLGIVVDKMGRTVFYLQLGMFTMLLAHIILALAPVSPYVGMFFLSIGFALLTSSISPMLSFIIPEHQLGTAFGVNMALVNLTYSINLLVAGALVDRYDFTTMEWYLLAWSILGFISSVHLWFQDRREDGQLNMSAKQRKLFAGQELKKDRTKEPLKERKLQADII